MLLIPDLRKRKGLPGELLRQPIGCINWPGQYPYAPEVTFAAAHDGTALYLDYAVREKSVMARVGEDNGRVWTDSCVECFLAPESGEGYYNFEFNCIGRVLVGYHRAGEATVKAGPETLSLIGRLSTLGTRPFDERPGDIRWRLTARIPAEALFMHRITDLTGLSMRANFYKCGDELSQPHYLSWNPIRWGNPNFHLPRFFGEVKFE